MFELKYEYTNRMFGDHGAYAAWFPTSSIRLGDYGTLDGRLFTVLGNVKSLGVEIGEPVVDAKGSADAIIHSSGATSATFAVGATIDKIVRAKAGINVSFATKYDFVLNLAGAYKERIGDIPTVMRKLIENSQLPVSDPHRWDGGGWRVVTSTLRVKNLTVLMSAGDNTEVTLEALGSVPNLDLADVNLKLQVTGGRIAGQQWITKIASDDAYFSPLFGMHKVRWFLSNFWFEAAAKGPGSAPTLAANGATAMADGDLGGV